MQNFNKVVWMGRLANDPEFKICKTGLPLVRFRSVANRSFTKKNGEKGEEACFMDCKAFRGRAKTISQTFKKGRPIFIEGHLCEEKWTGENDKNMRRIVLVVDNFEYLDKKDKYVNGKGSSNSSIDDPDMAGYTDDYDDLVEEAINGENN